MNLQTAIWLTKSIDPDPPPSPISQETVLYAAPAGGPGRLVMQPRGRLHVVALGQEPLPQPAANDAISFVDAFSGAPPAMAILGDASWRLRTPVRLRTGVFASDHPAALAAVSAAGAPAADRKVRIEATENVRFQVNGPLALAVRPFAVSIGGGSVPTVPAVAVNPQFTLDAAGKATSFVPVVAMSTVAASTWSTQPLAQAAPPPPVQTLGYGPGGDPWSGHLVYRTAAGAVLHLAP